MLKRGHLLVRIFFTFLLATVLIVGGFFAFVHWYNDDAPLGNIAGKNLAAYGDHLVDRVGEPPDQGRADALSRELELIVRVEDMDGRVILQTEDIGPGPGPGPGPGLGRWLHPDRVPGPGGPGAGAERGHQAPFSVLESHVWNISGDVKGGRWRGHWFVMVERYGHRYIFTLRGPPHPGPFPPHYAMAVFIAVILALSFLTIRWTLGPLNALLGAVEKIAAGDLGYRVELKRHGEFKSIAEAFNTLAGGIEAMVRGKERLLLDVSHELRSPLTRMKVASAMVSDPSLREGLEGDIREMEAMVSEILESYRLKSPHGALKKERVDLGAISADAVGRLNVVIERNGDLTLEADGARMASVFSNLVENALKHSKGASEPVRVRLTREDSKIACEIIDHGSGIADEDLKHVFEPFYRSDRSRDRRTGGFGLGLSITRDIIEAHGGKIEISSERGQGTTVRFTIPA